MTALAVLLAAIGGGVFLAHESRTGSPSTAPTDGPSVTAAPSPSPAETPPAVAQVRPAPSLAPAAPALRSPSPTVGAGAAPPVSRPSPGDASGRKATEAPPPAAPMSLAPTTLALAKAVTSEDDANGIAARLQVVRQAVSVAYGLNAGEMMTIIEAGIAGDDARTLASARTLMRNTEFTSGYADWNYTRASGRKLNDSALQTYKSDLRSATSTQLSAVALAPVDREIAANLAYYLALGRQPGVMGAASYSLSLPRPPDATGTASAWQMVGVAFARAGKLRESEGAFDVGLAITTKLPAFCLNLLTHEREMGPELRPPIEAVFKRIADRGQSDAANCAYPPQWLR